MDGQPTLFDWQAAQDAKAEGIGRAQRGIDPVWEGYALAAVRPHLTRTRRFTPDDLRRWVALTPRHHNHWPALLKKHEGRLWARTDEPYVSVNARGHGNRVYWWRSLRYAGGEGQ